MDIQLDSNDIIESLANKLSQAELNASQYQALAIAYEKKIQELQQELEQTKKEND